MTPETLLDPALGHIFLRTFFLDFFGNMGYLDTLCGEMKGILKDITKKENELEGKFLEVTSFIDKPTRCTAPQCKDLLLLVRSLEEAFMELSREKSRFSEISERIDMCIKNMYKEESQSKTTTNSKTK